MMSIMCYTICCDLLLLYNIKLILKLFFSPFFVKQPPSLISFALPQNMDLKRHVLPGNTSMASDQMNRPSKMMKLNDGRVPPSLKADSAPISVPPQTSAPLGRQTSMAQETLNGPGRQDNKVTILSLETIFFLEYIVAKVPCSRFLCNIFAKCIYSHHEVFRLLAWTCYCIIDFVKYIYCFSGFVVSLHVCELRSLCFSYIEFCFSLFRVINTVLNFYMMQLQIEIPYSTF